MFNAGCSTSWKQSGRDNNQPKTVYDKFLSMFRHSEADLPAPRFFIDETEHPSLNSLWITDYQCRTYQNSDCSLSLFDPSLTAETWSLELVNMKMIATYFRCMKLMDRKDQVVLIHNLFIKQYLAVQCTKTYHFLSVR